MIRQNKSTLGTGSSPNKRGVPKLIPDAVCKYKPRTCYQPALEDYDYCLKHILEDKNAPYKLCSFVYPINNKRCFMPAPRNDKSDNGYCALHIWKTHMKTQRKALKHEPPVTPEYLLSGLSHYVRTGKGNKDEDPKNPSKTRAINPFVEVDTAKASHSKLYVLECASESDSDVEPATLDNIWQGANEDSSDAESIDSQLDDSLKHSGYYTAEEVLAITRNKLIRLQILYQKQFDRLQYVYRERKRHYLQALRKEKETLSSICNQAKTSAKEQKLYDKLKALNRYHKRSNAETLAYLASLRKRAKVKELGGPNYKPIGGPTTRCSFTEGGVRCSKIILPLTKFCLQHVLEERSQVLFNPCGCIKADSNCQVPVVGVGSEETCLLHVRLPVLPHSNYPDMGIKIECDGDKKSTDESEIDASATESAFSTDQRDSPENSIINNDDIPRKEDESELIKFSESCVGELMEVTETPEVVKEEVIDENCESLSQVPI